MIESLEHLRIKKRLKKLQAKSYNIVAEWMASINYRYCDISLVNPSNLEKKKHNRLENSRPLEQKIFQVLQLPCPPKDIFSNSKKDIEFNIKIHRGKGEIQLNDLNQVILSYDAKEIIGFLDQATRKSLAQEIPIPSTKTYQFADPFNIRPVLHRINLNMSAWILEEEIDRLGVGLAIIYGDNLPNQNKILDYYDDEFLKIIQRLIQQVKKFNQEPHTIKIDEVEVHGNLNPDLSTQLNLIFHLEIMETMHKNKSVILIP